MDNKPDNSSADFDRNELASSDQLLVLYEQINQGISERRALIKSRNRVIQIAAISWLITLFVLFVLPELEKSKDIRRVNRPEARQLASQPAKPGMISYLPAATPTTPVMMASADEAEAYIRKVRRLLEETKVKKTSFVNKPSAETSSILSRSLVHYGSYKTNYSPEYKREISRFIYKWATIWELQDVTSYFQLYSGRFDPGSKANNVDAWKKTRGYYIRKPAWIKIQIDNIRIAEAGDSSATVVFNQTYQTPAYFDRTLKKLELMMEGGEWRIFRESGATQHIDFNPRQ